MTELRTKTQARGWAERSRICPHEHVRYNGAMPCTGARQCSMCLMEFSSEFDLDQARLAARQAIAMHKTK